VTAVRWPRWFTALAVAAIAANTAGCIGGELGTDHVETKFESAVRLSQDEPVASRHLTFVADAAPAASEARINIWVSKARADGVYERPDNVSVSVRPDDPAVVRPQGPPYEAVPGARLGVIGWCREGCELGVTIVAQSTSREPMDLRLIAEMMVLAPSGAQPSLATDAPPHISEDADRAFDGAPQAAVDTAQASVEVLPTRPTTHLDVRVQASASAIAARRTSPLIGSLVVRLAGDDRTHELLTGRSDYALGYVALSGQSTPLASEGADTEVDWLGACPETGDCSVTVGIDLSYQQLMGAARAASGYATPEPKVDAFRLQLEATALLEALDTSTVEPGAVTVTITTTD
jgi:hypothetical protein